MPGLVIIRWSAPLFFANATQFRDLVREAVRSATPPPKWVLIAAEPITDIDTTAGAMLADLDLELNASGIHLAFAELQSSVHDWVVRYELHETIDRAHFYRTVNEAPGRRSRARRAATGPIQERRPQCPERARGRERVSGSVRGGLQLRRRRQHRLPAPGQLKQVQASGIGRNQK